MNNYNIYKTTNLMNGKYYWGVHNSIDENDGYFGSGKYILNAIKKYGKENFRRITKFLYGTAEEAYYDEIFIVNKDVVADPMSYNTCLGGSGWRGNHSKEAKEKIRKFRMGFRHSEEMKQKMRILKKGKETWMKGRQHSEETKQKMSLAKSGKNHPLFGKNRSEETRRKISETLKRKSRTSIMET